MLRTRYIVDYSHPGWFHMAADDYLARTIIDKEYDAVLRFYTWEPTAISLGCHQKSDIVNIPECRKRGWDVVFRSTGGRALLHRKDLSYSLILKSAHDKFSRLHWLYNNISSAISTTMEKLGIETDITKLTPKRKTNYKTGLCLDARVRGEVSVKGKKVAAAAQHVYRDSLLQHGSIQLTGDPADIVEVVELSENAVSDIKSNLRNEACSLDTLSEDLPGLYKLIEMLKLSIVDVMSLEITNANWLEVEVKAIHDARANFEIASIDTAPDDNHNLSRP
ncbi:hypothetical protein K9N50_01820 [bacterium]|nr:hypothetical protein [bacterium]